MSDENEELDYTYVIGQAPTSLQRRFADFIMSDEVGYSPASAKTKEEAFREGVRMAVALRIPFQASDTNRRATQEEREDRAAARAQAAEEREALKAQRAAEREAKAAAKAAEPEPEAAAEKPAKVAKPAKTAAARKAATPAATPAAAPASTRPAPRRAAPRRAAAATAAPADAPF